MSPSLRRYRCCVPRRKSVISRRSTSTTLATCCHGGQLQTTTKSKFTSSRADDRDDEKFQKEHARKKRCRGYRTIRELANSRGDILSKCDEQSGFMPIALNVIVKLCAVRKLDQSASWLTTSSFVRKSTVTESWRQWAWKMTALTGTTSGAHYVRWMWLPQSWTWIGSIHGLHWVGLGGMTGLWHLFKFLIMHFSTVDAVTFKLWVYELLTILVLPQLKVSITLLAVSHIVYEFNSTPGIHGLDWTGSGKNGPMSNSELPRVCHSTLLYAKQLLDTHHHVYSCT